jgi:hypothetical protein
MYMAGSGGSQSCHLLAAALNAGIYVTFVVVTDFGFVANVWLQLENVAVPFLKPERLSKVSCRLISPFFRGLPLKELARI